MKVKVLHAQTRVKITELDLDEILEREDECLLGRSADSCLFLDSPDISRQHGKFFRQNGEIYYADLGSRNGSKVNNEIAQENQSYPLKPEDVIQAGEFILIIEETSDFPEEATVVRDLDVTVVSSIAIDARVIEETPGALVKVTTPSIAADDAKSQTKALFAAINKRILGEFRAAGSLTRDSYLKAVRKARESIENNKLIDPEEFEKEAEKHWQSLTKGSSALGGRLGSAAVKGASELGNRLGSAAVKGASGLGNRLGSAAKAAFSAARKEIAAPKSNSENGPNQSRSQQESHVPDAIISEEKRMPTSEAKLSQPAPENQLHLTHSEDAVSHLSLENQVKEDELPKD